MEQRPRNTKHTIAEWLPISWLFGGGFMVIALTQFVTSSVLVSLTIVYAWVIVCVGLVVYCHYTNHNNDKKKKMLRTEVLKNLACCKYEWSDPIIHGISDIYEIELTERTDVNEYALTIHSTHLGILIGFKGRNIDLVHSVIDDIFGYKIKIDFKEPDLFKNLYKKD